MIKNFYREVDKYPKRLRRKDKNLFLDYIHTKMTSMGYNVKKSEGRYIFKSINLETDNDEAEILLGAHYDTPTILPFYFEFLFKLFGHTRQFFMIFVIIILLTGIEFLINDLPAFKWVLDIIRYLFYLSFITLLIPNPKNRNDNTSGVVTLLDIAKKLSANEPLKKRVKFIFFDNEELGLLGSFMQAKKWKKQNFPSHAKKMITIDCVGRGEVPVIIYHKKDDIANQLKNIFHSQGETAKKVRLPFYPLSDNYVLGDTGAVNISWMDKTIIPGGFYIRDVHSPRDTDIDYDKLATVSEAVLTFINHEHTNEK